MAGYDVFARYYDALTANVDYKGRAAYLKKLLEHLHHEPGIVLDLACGTGSLTLELYKLGMDVYGVDGSIAMLSEAKDKAYDMEADVMFLCQKMQTLDLFGTVNTVFCSLDSINHLSGEAQVQAAFDRVAFFMDNDSWFIFDVNTLYKHEKVLGNNTLRIFTAHGRTAIIRRITVWRSLSISLRKRARSIRAAASISLSTHTAWRS